MSSNPPPVPVSGNVRTQASITPVDAISGFGPRDAKPRLIERVITGLTTGQPVILLEAANDRPVFVYQVTIEPTTAIPGGLAGRWTLGIYQPSAIDTTGELPVATGVSELLRRLIDRYVAVADGYSRFPLEWRAPWEGWPQVMEPGKVLAFNIGSSNATIAIGLTIKVLYRT